MVRTEYERSYASCSCPVPGPGKEVAVTQTAQDKDLNIFDCLPALAKPRHHPTNNELNAYLNTPIEDVDHALKWWQQRCTTYPHLSRVVLDYLTIPATSVNVERVFSCGHLLLSHVRS
ncbi:hypothetical protein CY34DRAFT_13654 [Suillus luteus UH-Slu-Lm8-n1]|uniref:HAT C-terminal dimerisation domain-containing protein n=1 Tax=Suillus luteus UH-Slu-Lm8-n1 TaxID=930992 RepID=A0A0D0AFP1_9AGAM|nr:hypothetical protein CY34DRAFT_13654 [Suillus luteus UH-Slu-Lm8-n1]